MMEAVFDPSEPERTDLNGIITVEFTGGPRHKVGDKKGFHHLPPKLREAEPGGFQTRVFPTFFGKGPDCVADPFGTVPRRCS